LKLGEKRKATQILTLIIANLGFFRVLKTGFICPFLYCHGCPFALLGCPIGVLQHLIIFGQFPFFTLGSLGIYGMLFGRAFCGWACPFGALHDLMSRSGKKRIRVSRYWYVKYVMLLVVLASAWIALDTVFCKFCPSGSLFAAIPFHLLNLGFTEIGVFFYVHMLTLAATVLMAVLISRFWCRYLCPLGAIEGAFNRISLLNIRRNRKKCTECGGCLHVCSMGITRVEDIGRSSDCILCGRCVESCPEKALEFIMKYR